MSSNINQLSYDEPLKRTLARVYGKDLDKILEVLTKPSNRYYIRVNMLRTSPATVIESLRSRGIEVYRDEELPEAIYMPVKGPYNVELKDKVVVVNKYAAESVYMGSHLYVPGIVKCPSNVRQGDDVTIVAENGVIVGEGRILIDCRDVIKMRYGLAVEVTRSVYKIPPIKDLPEYKEGWIYPQSLPAMYATRVLDPKPYELIVDVCAAPGGKTGHAVELSKGGAHVIAFDHSRKRLRDMIIELDRLGHTQFVEIWRADSRYLHIDFSWVKADKVIIDPPCSALGVRPKIFDVKTYKEILNVVKYQIQFLRSATKILKKGGILIYSTCTMTLEENEELIEAFLEEERCLEPQPVEVSRGSRGFRGSRYGDMYLRFHPHIHDTSGYFIAKLAKKC